MKIIFKIFLMLNILFSKITIVKPEKLVEKLNLDSNNIDYNLSLFGKIDYLNSIKVKLVYDKDNKHGCNEFNKKLYEGFDNYVFLIKKGNCSFENKSINTEKAGGYASFLYFEDEKIDIKQFLTFAVDYKNEKVPLILIDKIISEKLINELEKNTEIILNVDFDLPGKMDEKKVNFEYWMTLESKSSYKFLKEFYKYKILLKDEMDFKPLYRLENYEDLENKYIKDICIDNGKYCIVGDNLVSEFIKPKEIFYEIMRQICLFENSLNNENEDTWWNYISVFYNKCIRKVDEMKDKSFYNCSKEIINYLDVYDFEKINHCSVNSFSNKDVNINSKNEKLDDYSNSQLKYDKENIDAVPVVLIDKYMLKGNTSPENTFTAICDKLKHKPNFCNSKYNFDLINYFKEDKQDVFGIGFKILVVLFFFLFFYILYYIIFKHIFNKSNNNIKEEIKNYMTEYNKIKNNKDNKDEDL